MRRASLDEQVLRGSSRAAYADAVMRMVHATYASIGVKVSSVDELLSEYDLWVLALHHGEPTAFYLMKSTPFGLKAGLGGSDGSAEGKSYVARQLRTSFHKPDVYGEVSHKVRDIVLSSGAPVVCPVYVSKVLGKPITPAGVIDYERTLSGVGRVVKTMVGSPRGVPTTSAHHPSCPSGSTMTASSDSDDLCDLHAHLSCLAADAPPYDEGPGMADERVVEHLVAQKMAHNAMPSGLSHGAQMVYKQVLEAMQDADEMGGTEDYADYIKLMEAISKEALERARTAKANWDYEKQHGR